MMKYPDSFIEFEDIAVLRKNKVNEIKAVMITTSENTKLLDIRLWNDGIPSTCGLFFSEVGVSKLDKAIELYKQKLNSPGTLSELVNRLGYNPFADK